MNPPSTPQLHITVRELHPHSIQKNGVVDLKIKETTTIGQLKHILSHPDPVAGKYILNHGRWQYDDDRTLVESGITEANVDQLGHNAVFVRRSADLTPIGIAKITDEDEILSCEGKDSDSISSSDNDDDGPLVDPNQRRTITQSMVDFILSANQSKATNTVVDVMEEMKTQQPSPSLPLSVSVLLGCNENPHTKKDHSKLRDEELVNSGGSLMGDKHPAMKAMTKHLELFQKDDIPTVTEPLEEHVAEKRMVSR